MSIRHGEFTIERAYPHSRDRAYRAFADPELKRRWFANPGNWANGEWDLDFRVGGTEISRGGNAGGRYNEFEATYQDIRENERIVYAYRLLHDRRLISVSLTTIEFEDDEGGSIVRFTEQGAFFDEPDGPEQREHGTGILLDMFGSFLDEGAVE